MAVMAGLADLAAMVASMVTVVVTVMAVVTRLVRLVCVMGLLGMMAVMAASMADDSSIALMATDGRVGDAPGDAAHLRGWRQTAKAGEALLVMMVLGLLGNGRVDRH